MRLKNEYMYIAIYNLVPATGVWQVASLVLCCAAPGYMIHIKTQLLYRLVDQVCITKSESYLLIKRNVFVHASIPYCRG